jgi:hypothetical protein
MHSCLIKTKFLFKSIKTSKFSQLLLLSNADFYLTDTIHDAKNKKKEGTCSQVARFSTNQIQKT